MSKYNIRLNWNGTDCLTGKATASCAVETIRNFLERNYIGSTSRHCLSEFDKSKPLERLLKNGVIHLDYFDETGRIECSAIAECDA